VTDGFNVLNKGQGVSFPGSGRQKEFRFQFSAILGSEETLTDGNRSLMPQQKKPRTGMRHQRKRHGVSDLLFTVKGFLTVKGFRKDVKELGKELKWLGKELKWLGKGLKQGHLALIEAALEIANRYGLDEERYRQSLRQQAENDPRLSWHDPGERWEAPIGSPGHDAMIEVAERLAAQSW
jgi:hypothetical protein